jgi:hypothetical protein
MSKKKPKTLSDLKPAPYNPRTITQDAMHGLSTSIDEFGDLSGITYNTRTGHLVTGHQRVKSLGRFGDLEIKDGYVDTPNGERFKVRLVDWDEMKEKAANVAANSPLLTGDFTDDLSGLIEEININIPDLAMDLRFEELTYDFAGENGEINLANGDIENKPGMAKLVIMVPRSNLLQARIDAKLIAQTYNGVVIE